MFRQKGQTAVEFAIIAPIFFLICFAAIYAGITFMDYFNYNNYARMAARQISLADDKSEMISKVIDKYKPEDDQSDSLYSKTFNAKIETDETNVEEVVVEVTFELNKKGIPSILVEYGFPPEEFNIVYKMPLEKYGSEN